MLKKFYEIAPVVATKANRLKKIGGSKKYMPRNEANPRRQDAFTRAFSRSNAII
jgi:hypothetical protein